MASEAEFRAKQVERLIAATRSMRFKQREFFQTKDRNALAASKEWEREVDALLDAIDRIDRGPK